MHQPQLPKKPPEFSEARISAGRRIINLLFRRSRNKGEPRPRLERTGLGYLRFIPKTCRLIISPPDILALEDRYSPFIIATWHGQAYILPFVLRLKHKIRILTSGSSDGQIFARTIKQLGHEAIVGSGAALSSKDMIRKRGLAAFEEMLKALAENNSVASTADVPPIAGVCGLGIIKLARRSGRPIVPVAVMTSHRFVIPIWDRTIFNLPLGRLVIAVGDPIRVEDTDDAGYLEKKRKEVEVTLNFLNTQAKELAAYWRLGERHRPRKL